ncbi:hypothetical protein BXZ70DRAFT_928422 [Cristinia sonorae]|uniref:Transmembrane protein n=1 Tax=Cristinia sonorae TaxID=1940300 RepID=A0A8K0URQ5_9AGAR|nr:hypothetical protein BXZ70DRAFT_928422 [Cristinia sonorae]
MKKRLPVSAVQSMILWLLCVNCVLSIPLSTVFIRELSPTAAATRLPDIMQRRALDDIFNTLQGSDPTLAVGHNAPKAEATHEPDSTNTHDQHTTPNPNGLLGHLTAIGSSTTTTGTPSGHSSTGAATTTQGGRYSIIGSLPPVPTPTGGHTIMTSWGSPSIHAFPTSTSSPGTNTNASGLSSKDQAIKQWKIIGVAVIAFSTVAAILLLAVFFDQWWRFIKDVCGNGKKNKGLGNEELVPDWEKASWEVRFGDDRHRYPSFSSFPSEAGEGKARVGGASTGNEGGWTRPQKQPSPLRDEVQDTSGSTQEVDISTISPYYDPLQPPSPARQQTYASHLSPQRNPSLTRSKSQRSQRDHDPFDDPQQLQLPRSPRTRSISARSIGGESVYGGIAMIERSVAPIPSLYPLSFYLTYIRSYAFHRPSTFQPHFQSDILLPFRRFRRLRRWC